MIKAIYNLYVLEIKNKIKKHQESMFAVDVLNQLYILWKMSAFSSLHIIY